MSFTNASLGIYGKDFQEKVMQSLLVDHPWAEQMSEVFEPTYFDLKYLSYLSETFFNYSKTYKTFPTFKLLVSIIKDKLKKGGSDAILSDQIVKYLLKTKSNPDPGDLAYVKEKSLDFCKKQSLKLAIEQSVDLMQKESIPYEQIIDVIKKAVIAGTTSTLGHEFFNILDLDARYTEIARNPVATGIPQLDNKTILNGGLGAGELGIVVAPTGVGKSHLLVQFGAAAIAAGINVVHYTFELSETATGKRYDSHLSGISINDLIENKQNVIKFYEDNKKNFGNLIIKYYPTNTATIQTLRGHLERCNSKGFQPGLIIIDYPDIMRSSRQFDSLRHELKLVYEELRGFAGELDIPIWGASQSNKEGSNSQVVDLTNLSEAYGKAQVADVIISLSRKSEEKAMGIGRLYVAKNRAGKDGLLWPVKIDTARSKITVDGDENTLSQSIDQDIRQTKTRIREKLDDIKKDAESAMNS